MYPHVERTWLPIGQGVISPRENQYHPVTCYGPIRPTHLLISTNVDFLQVGISLGGYIAFGNGGTMNTRPFQLVTTWAEWLQSAKLPSTSARPGDLLRLTVYNPAKDITAFFSAAFYCLQQTRDNHHATS